MKKFNLLHLILLLTIFLSYGARSQNAQPNPVCYGQPINLYCAELYGCGATNATYSWTNYSGSWTYSAYGSSYFDPILNPGDIGYATDRFYLSIEFAPPVGGSSSGSTFVNVLPEINITGTQTNVQCFGSIIGSISITASGGTPPYTYLWSNNSTTRNQTGLAAGSYTVTVTDLYLCSQSAGFTVTGPASALASSSEVTNVFCNGEWTGAIDLTVTGGTGPYEYLWSNGAITEDISNVPAGLYTVSITDANSCTQTDSWIVNDPSNLLWLASVTNVSCFGADDGSISGTTFGGVPPYSYLWSNGATTCSISGLEAGLYYLTVSDAHGCDFRTNRHVYQPDPFTVISDVVVSPGCHGASDGKIEVIVAGGTLPYTFTWSNNAATQNIGDLTAGTYCLTVTDGHDCTVTGCWSVQEPLDIIPAETISPVSCYGWNDGSIALSVSGGVAPYSFLWSTGMSTPNINYLYAGTYTVTITDQSSCFKTGSYTISQSQVMCQRMLQNLNILSGWKNCYDATQTITVAGNGTTFTVQNGGDAILIAGQKINFLTGTSVQPGGYLHASITTDGQYCSTAKNTPVPDADQINTEKITNPDQLSHPFCKVYPNPTSGNFTLELTRGDPPESVRIVIFGMHGDKVIPEELMTERKQVFSLIQSPPGIYFIKVVTATRSEIVKIIKI